MYIKITKVLIDLEKELRKKNSIKVQEVSEYINKHKSYISVFERGKLNSIPVETFISIFKRISGIYEDYKFMEYMENLILELPNEEMVDQDWIDKFTLQIREFTISNEMVQFIKLTLEEINTTAVELVHQINSNKELYNKKTYKYNELVLFKDTKISSNIQWKVKYKLNEDFLVNILDKKIKRANFINMFAVIYNMLLIKESNPMAAKIATGNVLKKYGFITIRELKQSHSVHDNTKFIIQLKRLDDFFKLVDLKDPEYAKKILNKLLQNMEFDVGFMTSIFCLPFFQLNRLPIKDRQDFVLEIKSLIEGRVDG